MTFHLEVGGNSSHGLLCIQNLFLWVPRCRRIVLGINNITIQKTMGKKKGLPTEKGVPTSKRWQFQNNKIAISFSICEVWKETHLQSAVMTLEKYAHCFILLSTFWIFKWLIEGKHLSLSRLSSCQWTILTEHTTQGYRDKLTDCLANSSLEKKKWVQMSKTVKLTLAQT